MTNNFQNEIPKARINITLDVETEGARKAKELPLKLLVLGDFSYGKTTGPVAERERININQTNFNAILKDLSPQLQYTVPNYIKNDGTDMQITLRLDSLQQFHPEAVAQQVPELRNLVAMRHLLKDLKANVLDNITFRRELEKIIQQKPMLDALQAERQTQST